jgi:peroxiredoxin
MIWSILGIFGIVTGCVPSLYTADFGQEWVWEAPENSWISVEPPATEENTSFYVGDVVPDFRLKDQFGETVSMWQFYSQIVLLDVSTMWCGPCQTLGATTEETWENYKDEGFIYMTVLQENVGGVAPTQGDLETWSANFGISQPVLADGDKIGTGDAIQQGAYPALLIIDRDLRVHTRIGDPTDEAVHAALEAIF